MKAPSLGPIYACLYPDLAQIARDHGYALAILGTTSSCVEMIATPWSHLAVSTDDLMRALCKHLNYQYKESERPVDWPHGRRTWTIALKVDGFWAPSIDLSVMPRRSKTETHFTKGGGFPGEISAEMMAEIKKRIQDSLKGETVEPTALMEIKERGLLVRPSFVPGHWRAGVWAGSTLHAMPQVYCVDGTEWEGDSIEEAVKKCVDALKTGTKNPDFEKSKAMLAQFGPDFPTTRATKENWLQSALLAALASDKQKAEAEVTGATLESCRAKFQNPGHCWNVPFVPPSPPVDKATLLTKLEAILSGIAEGVPCGWWESEAGVSFGKRKLEEVRKLFAPVVAAPESSVEAVMHQVDLDDDTDPDCVLAKEVIRLREELAASKAGPKTLQEVVACAWKCADALKFIPMSANEDMQCLKDTRGLFIRAANTPAHLLPRT